MKLRNRHLHFFLFSLFSLLFPLLITSCASSTPVSKLTLDQAIERCAKSLDEKLAGSRIAVPGCYSRSDKLSLYVLDEITACLKESGKLTLVDRAEIDPILSECGVSNNYNYRTGEGQRAERAVAEKLNVRFIVSGYVDYSRNSGDNIEFNIWDLQKNQSVATAGWYYFANDEFFRSLLEEDDLNTLDDAIEGCAAELDNRFEGEKVALINFESIYNKLNLYILDKMTTDLEKSEKLTIVGRAEMDPILREFKFSYSSNNSDNIKPRTLQAIGERLGVQFIVYGYLFRSSVKGDGIRFFIWDIQQNKQVDGAINYYFVNDAHFKSLQKTK
jgi:TolB-like protein